MLKRITAAFLFLFSACVSSPEKLNQGLITKTGSESVEKTVGKAVHLLKSKGLRVFEVVRHHKGALSVGIQMPETVLIIFGNPKLGSLFMLESPSMAIDLPLKLLIKKGRNSHTEISYNSPLYLKKRHHLKESAALKKMTKALNKITDALVK